MILDYHLLSLNNSTSNNNSIASNSPNEHEGLSSILTAHTKGKLSHCIFYIGTYINFFFTENNTRKSSSIGSISPNRLMENDGKNFFTFH